MKLRERIRLRRLLRRSPLLTASSPDGSHVLAVGHAYSLEDEDPFVPPIAGVPCVVAWSKITTGGDVQNRRNPPVQIERMMVRPFELHTGQLSVIVESGHIELLLPILEQGRSQEKHVRDGELIAVFGTVLRDGVDMPHGDIAFREVAPTIRIVGNKQHPVVITAPLTRR